MKLHDKNIISLIEKTKTQNLKNHRKYKFTTTTSFENSFLQN